MKVTADNNGEVGKYCGELTGNEVVVSGDYAVLTFHTDGIGQKKGFRIFFSAIQLGKCCGIAA